MLHYVLRYLAPRDHLLIVFYINFINPASYDEYIYVNALCKINMILSMTRTLLLDHYQMPYYRSY